MVKYSQSVFTGNKTLVSQLGVLKGLYWFPNPARPTARVFIVPDIPHLVKLLR